MSALKECEVVGTTVMEVLCTDQELATGGVVRAYYLVLDTGIPIQLLPFGLRVEAQMPQSAVADMSREARLCVGRQITATITDSRAYHPAHMDKSLANPPYDDAYVVLDRQIWVANRFFANAENSLTVDGKDELLQFSDAYYDYWTRERVDLKLIIGPG